MVSEESQYYIILFPVFWFLCYKTIFAELTMCAKAATTTINNLLMFIARNYLLIINKVAIKMGILMSV